MPLSYELQDYFKQNEFFYLKLDAEENKMERIIFHTNKHDDGINNKGINDKGINDKGINDKGINDDDKHYFDTLYSFLEKRNNFGDIYWFIEDNMNELNSTILIDNIDQILSMIIRFINNNLNYS